MSNLLIIPDTVLDNIFKIVCDTSPLSIPKLIFLFKPQRWLIESYITRAQFIIRYACNMRDKIPTEKYHQLEHMSLNPIFARTGDLCVSFTGKRSGIIGRCHCIHINNYLTYSIVPQYSFRWGMDSKRWNLLKYSKKIYHVSKQDKTVRIAFIEINENIINEDNWDLRC